MTDQPQPITIDQVEQFLQTCVDQAEAARILDVGVTQVRNLVKKSHAKVLRPGKKCVAYPRHQIEALAAERQAADAAKAERAAEAAAAKAERAAEAAARRQAAAAARRSRAKVSA